MRKSGLLLLFFLQLSCSSQVERKVNGVSFVASRIEAAQEHVDEVLKVNANHAAVMPFGFIRDINSPEIIFDTDRQWYGETRRGAKQYIELLHKNNIQVMLKPQIWIWNGVFTGTLTMNSEEDWKKLEVSYDRFMLNYAQLGQETGVSIMCIGTELEAFVEHRPDYWKALIKKVRAVYKGRLTYAANWDEYKRTPFWKDLDYIGIDAYFPLSEEKTPTVEELKQAWQPWKLKIASLSKETGKPVLFTEFGYRSMDYTAKKPWLVDRTGEGVNMEGQVNCKKAIFEEFWKEDWFSGGYVWKWFINHSEVGGGKDNRFTPQNKPAQEIISSYYKMH
ncbi:MAG TPA: glycoside hydrolase TIM-barrel-like domain-containing protein [Eudoraea sp.]|nr:glycoside hydrolase TIM-barrel-like domain-containing protein [Eudoraea sp.]